MFGTSQTLPLAMVHLVHENIWTTKTTMIITKRNEQMIDDPVGSIGFVFVRHLTYGLYGIYLLFIYIYMFRTVPFIIFHVIPLPVTTTFLFTIYRRHRRLSWCFQLQRTQFWNKISDRHNLYKILGSYFNSETYSCLFGDDDRHLQSSSSLPN